MLFIEGAFTKFQLYKKRKTEHFIFFLFTSHLWGIKDDESHAFPCARKKFASNFHSVLKENIG